MISVIPIELYLLNYTYVSDIKYIVTVITGDKLGAGTDADVYLQIFGDLGKTSCYIYINP